MTNLFKGDFGVLIVTQDTNISWTVLQSTQADEENDEIRD